MAINYVVSYTFTSGTTISSSQVNTNFSDNANTWTGLEALTKSFSNLRVDTAPTVSTDVAIKTYVDHLNAYRRPTLQYSSATVVNLETGINGTSGQVQILFPDGTLRTDSTASRINFDITRNAALSGTAQSGLRTSLSEATNTWYALYAVKVSDSSTNFVVVGDTVFPIQANVATLNSNLGSNSWVHLGYILNGDGGSTNSDIMKFRQVGNYTKFYNKLASGDVAAGVATNGVLISNTASAASLNWAPTSGSAWGSQQIPNTVNRVQVGCWLQGSANPHELYDSGQNYVMLRQVSNGESLYPLQIARDEGVLIRDSAGGNLRLSLVLTAFWDSVLGIGASPFL